MFRAYASFLLHLTPEMQRRLPRLDFQATQAVFRAAVTHAAGGAVPVTAVIKGEHVTITSREREDVFGAAVATTYSLDFETALAVPVTLALFAAESRDEILTHPLALLEGAERIAGQLLIFMDAGHIQAQTRPHSRLCTLLERIIVEVAPLGDGVFHPKIWVLRYTPVRPEDPIRLRLLTLSRNLTRDRSWDIALTLDGIVENQPKAVNRPLADFIRGLPGLATAGTPAGAPALVDALAEDTAANLIRRR